MARFFYTCPCCGANLDPGEKCDCRAEAYRKKRMRENMLIVTSGQIKMNMEALRHESVRD